MFKYFIQKKTLFNKNLQKSLNNIERNLDLFLSLHKINQFFYLPKCLQEINIFRGRLTGFRKIRNKKFDIFCIYIAFKQNFLAIKYVHCWLKISFVD